MRGLNKIKKDQSGMAAIVVVGLLIVLLSLITLGFARLMGRSVQNATNNQTAAAATYAAQSGINDLATFITTHPDTYANNCNDLIGTSTLPNQFYNDANVSGDNNTRYTCLLVNQRPTDLAYQNLASLKSKVIKLNTDTVDGTIDSFMFSWQSRDNPAHNVAPNPSTALLDETTWNNNDYLPGLRVTLYPILTNNLLDNNVQTNSRTYFFLPANGGGVKTVDYQSTADGSKLRIQCDKTQITGFTGTSDYTCNAVIAGLEKVTGIKYYYARILPLYNNIDLKVKGNDIDLRAVKFKNVQAVLDVTAKAGQAAKRLQARVDISGVNTVTGTVSDSVNVSASDNSEPDYSIRSAEGVCKRYVLTNDVYNYLTIDGACATSTGSGGGGVTVTTPAPTLSLNIDGILSSANTPSAPYLGTEYIAGGGSATVKWNTTDATLCTGSDTGWNGSQNSYMTFNPDGTGIGTRGFSGISTVSTYTLTCRGPGSGVSPGVSKTVVAWPTPAVSFNPSTITAGNGWSLSWSVSNSISCTAGGSWSGSKSSSVTGNTFSQDMGTWPWNDTGSHTYTLTCTDPIGRSTFAQIIVGNPQGTSGSGSNATGHVNAPDCSTFINPNAIEYNGGGYQWNATCPNVSPGDGGYHYDISGPSSTSGDGYGASSGIWFSPQGGSYCMTLKAWAPGWGDINSPNSQSSVCQNIYTIHVSGFQALVWDEGPNQCNATSGASGQWLCRNNPSVINMSSGCPDGVHRWHACAGDVHWSWYFDGGLSGNYSCTASANNYGNFWSLSGNAPNGNPSSGTGLGWANSGSPYAFNVTCNGPAGSASQSWNG